MTQLRSVILVALVLSLISVPAVADGERRTGHSDLHDIPRDRYIVTHVQGGVIFSIKPLEPLRIGGRLYGHHGIWLWNTGAVRGGTVLEATPIPGGKAPPLTTLFLHPGGQLHKVSLARDTLILGVWLAGHREFTYHPSGRLKSFTLARTQKVGEHLYLAGMFLTLDPDGRVKEARRPGRKP